MNKLYLFAFALCVSCAHFPKEQEKIRVYIFDCGENNVNDISLFSPGIDKGKEKTLPINCYLIAHPKGMLMWDTGLTDKLVSKPEGIRVRNASFLLKMKRSLESQLNEIGIPLAQEKDMAYPKRPISFFP